jgi:hypothetical protein
MRRFKGSTQDQGGLVRVRVAGVGVLIFAVFAVGNASVASAVLARTKLCIPKAAGQPVRTPTGKGRCPRRYKLVDLGRQGQPGRDGQPGPSGPKGERGEKGEAGVEALQFTTYGEGVFTGGQVVSVPAGSYGPEKVAPENTISYGPVTVSAHSVVTEIHVSGTELLGEVTADVHVQNLTGTQSIGGVTGRVIPKGKAVLLELTHIGFQAGTDLYLKEGKLYSETAETYWVKVGVSLPPR